MSGLVRSGQSPARVSPSLGSILQKARLAGTLPSHHSGPYHLRTGNNRQSVSAHGGWWCGLFVCVRSTDLRNEEIKTSHIAPMQVMCNPYAHSGVAFPLFFSFFYFWKKKKSSQKVKKSQPLIGCDHSAGQTLTVGWSDAWLVLLLLNSSVLPAPAPPLPAPKTLPTVGPCNSPVPSGLVWSWSGPATHYSARQNLLKLADRWLLSSQHPSALLSVKPSHSEKRLGHRLQLRPFSQLRLPVLRRLRQSAQVDLILKLAARGRPPLALVVEVRTRRNGPSCLHSRSLSSTSIVTSSFM